MTLGSFGKWILDNKEFIATIVGFGFTSWKIIQTKNASKETAKNNKRTIETSLKNNRDNIRASLTAKSRVEWIQNARDASIDFFTCVGKYLVMISKNNALHSTNSELISRNEYLTSKGNSKGWNDEISAEVKANNEIIEENNNLLRNDDYGRINTELLNAYYKLVLYFPNKGISSLKNININDINKADTNEALDTNEKKKCLELMKAFINSRSDYLNFKKSIHIEPKSRYKVKRDSLKYSYLHDLVEYLYQDKSNMFKNFMIVSWAKMVIKELQNNKADNLDLLKMSSFTYSISLYFKIEWDKAKTNS